MAMFNSKLLTSPEGNPWGSHKYGHDLAQCEAPGHDSVQLVLK